MSTLVDGTGLCKGVVEPKFVPTTFDLAKIVNFAVSGSNKPKGSIVFYSNIDELVNFYLQGASDATEAIVSNYNTYTDGYAITVNYSFPQSSVTAG